MKFFLKFVVLLALIVGGRLSKSPHNAVLTAAPTPAAAASVAFTTPRIPTPPPARNPRQPEPARPQVLSVFFK